jgi:hypothetical protein
MEERVWHELTSRTVAGGRGWYTVGIYAPNGTRIASVVQEQYFASRRVRWAALKSGGPEGSDLAPGPGVPLICAPQHV